MKTLKFRAWNAGNNERMNNRDIRIFLDGSIAVYDNTPLSPDYFPKYYPLITICQFIGQYDKNKNDIYEGDLVVNGDYIYEIVYRAGFARFCAHRNGENIFWPLGEGEQIEVIGNVFENHELMEAT